MPWVSNFKDFFVRTLFAPLLLSDLVVSAGEGEEEEGQKNDETSLGPPFRDLFLLCEEQSFSIAK